MNHTKTGEIWEAFTEWELILQILRAIESANNGNLNITNINNIIEIIFGNNTNFTLDTPSPTAMTGAPTQRTEFTPTRSPTLSPTNPIQLFENVTDVIDADGSFNQAFVVDLLEFIGEVTGSTDTINQVLSFITPPDQPDCINGTSNNTFMDIFMFFESQEAMEDYTQFRDYGDGKPAISAGIVFKHVSNESIDYVLRFNQTDVQDTTSPYVDKYGRSPLLLMEASFLDYINSGFLGWQNAIDQTFLRVLNYQKAVDLKVGVHAFPFPPYEDDLFWSVVGTLLPLLLVIAFSYPFVIIAKTIVDEKSRRLKVL